MHLKKTQIDRPVDDGAISTCIRLWLFKLQMAFPKGAQFANTYTSSPLCVPARRALKSRSLHRGLLFLQAFMLQDPANIACDLESAWEGGGGAGGEVGGGRVHSRRVTSFHM